MENRNYDNESVQQETLDDARFLFEQAKADICADMSSRDIGAIMWNNQRAGFHYPPVINMKNAEGKSETWEIQGLYRVQDAIFLISDHASVNVDDYYEKGIETPPVIVTLTPDQATGELGLPSEERGFTRQGSIQEWLTIADCYFEALTLNNDI